MVETNDFALSILNEPMALGKVFAESGIFTDTKTQAQAVVKILAGKEMGLSPMQSMTGLYMTSKGMIGVMAKTAGALIKKSPTYDYSIESLDEKECVLKFFNIVDGKELGISKFTWQDGAKAGLVNKDVWKSYPRNMLFARALSNGITWYCPDVLCGNYLTEELQDLSEATEKPKTTVVITEDDFKVEGEQPCVVVEEVAK